MSPARLPRRFFLGLTVAMAVCLLANGGRAADPPKKEMPGQLSAIDFEDCDPVRMRARIMGINPVNGALIVGEREIRTLDVHSGGKSVKTAFLNPEGKPESPADFMVGQEVLVKGMLHPEGFVAALVVQKTGAGTAAEETRLKRKDRKERPADKPVRRKHHRRPPPAPEAAALSR